MSWYVGLPKSGKTSLALNNALASARSSGVPLILIDSGEVTQFEKLPRYSVSDVIEACWAEPRCQVAHFVPRSREELWSLCRAIRKGKNVVVLVDEAAFWLGGHTSSSDELLRLLRSTQHSQTELHLTTQHLSGDVPSAALSCTSDLFVFKASSPRVLDVLEKDYGIPRERVSALGQLEFLKHRIGFEQ